MQTPGKRFEQAMAQEAPLQIAGVINAYAAKLAEQAGFKALYLSGAGVANAEFALPDLAMTSLNDVLTTVNRIVDVCELPLIVDSDTGWGSPINVTRTFRLLSRAGAAGAHIEDQSEAKRCGHNKGKSLVSTDTMCQRIKAAIEGRIDPDFKVIARTDALAVEGEEETLARAKAYQAAGADGLFLEAVTDIEQYQRFSSALSIPIMANMTEFGKTPLSTVEALKKVGVTWIIYPQSAFRAMSQAALAVYQTLKTEGTQQSQLSRMQTRDALYETLNFSAYETIIDAFNQNKET